eukprot:2056193-Amphidinium_carterae.1
MNSWARHMESKMIWGDRSAGGDWDQPRRYWGSSPYKSPFKNAEHNTAWNNDGKYTSGEWVARPHYSNLTYRPNDPKGDGKGKKSGKENYTAREPTDPATEDTATGQHPRQEARGSHTENTDIAKAKCMPSHMTRVVDKPGGGSALLPAEATEESAEDQEIEAALRASMQYQPHVERVNTILESDSPALSSYCVQQGLCRLWQYGPGRDR